jgi:UDP-N-acetyl-2-amino-2-deoxyglucuronate dehydrogenase
MTKINFAIIGCGRIAERHAKHIAHFGKLVAVCDKVELKAKALADTYGVNYYTDISLLLSSETAIDVVAICTPNGLHAKHAIQVLQAGYHALVEKPMAITVADCEAMITAAKRAGKHLFAIKQNRYNPPVVAVKQAIENDKLGKIYSLQLSCFWNRSADYYQNSWKGTMALDGGTLFTQFSHFIDLLYWLFGDVKQVQVITKNLAHKGVIEFEDTGVIALEFDNGAIGTINYTVNSYLKNMEGSLTIFAEKGTVKIGGQYLNELEYQNIQDFVIDNLPRGNTANNYGTYEGSMSNHDKVYENVVDVLQNDAAMYTTAFDAMKTVEIIDKIYKAATFTNKA